MRLPYETKIESKHPRVRERNQFVNLRDSIAMPVLPQPQPLEQSIARVHEAVAIPSVTGIIQDR